MAKQAEEKLETHRPLAVRCIALKDGALYKAVCIDLGLYVQRASLSDAMQELEELIHSYVNDALEAGIPWEHLLRPIPKEERLRLYARLLRAELRAWASDILGGGRRNGSSATHETRLCYV